MNKIVDRFGMNDSKPVATPMEEPKSTDHRLELVTDQDEDAVGVPYREAIGSLMYLIIGSRPDIAYAIRKLARFCEQPKLNCSQTCSQICQWNMQDGLMLQRTWW